MKFMMGWGWSCITIEPFLQLHLLFNGSALSGVPGHMICIYIRYIYLIFELENIALDDSNLVGEESMIIKKCLTRARKCCHIAIVSQSK